jgi:hypothetical protein
MIRFPQDRLLPVPVHAPQDKSCHEQSGQRSGRASRPDNPFAAQLFGQDGQRRGLRGGAPVLEAARSAYLGAEYSGENDRRPTAGLIIKKAI